MSGRTIVLGDLHGCYDELELVLDLIGLKADDRVVAVGDLVTKGPKNREVLDRFIGDGRFSAVLGNHDRALLRHWRGDDVSLKPAQARALAELGGRETRYAAYLQSLPLMIDLGAHVVVHAGVRPGVALDEQSVEDLTTLRTLGADRTSRAGVAWYDVYAGEKIVLFGHWPAPAPRRAARAIGLDTGCVYGYQLTAYIIETDEFAQVRALEVYVQPPQQLA